MGELVSSHFALACVYASCDLAFVYGFGEECGMKVLAKVNKGRGRTTG